MPVGQISHSNHSCGDSMSDGADAGAGTRPDGAAAASIGSRKLPLTVVLLGLVSAVLLPALAFGGLAAWQAAQANKVAAAGRLHDTVHALALSVDREIGGIESTLLALAASTVLDGPAPDLQRCHQSA